MLWYIIITSTIRTALFRRQQQQQLTVNIARQRERDYYKPSYHNRKQQPPAASCLVSSLNMSLAASRIVATRAMARRVTTQPQQQKRGIVDYLTNYPDKVRTHATPSRHRRDLRRPHTYNANNPNPNIVTIYFFSSIFFSLFLRRSTK